MAGPCATSALVLFLPEVDRVLGAWRAGHDPRAVSAHITVLYPWLPPDAITDVDLAAVAEIAAEYRPFEFVFERVGRFTGGVWLAPEPAGPIRALTAQVRARWPQCPPYGGEYDDDEEVGPHVTLALDRDEAELPGLAREVAPYLPVRDRVTHMALVASGSTGAWESRGAFAFTGTR